MRESLWSFPLGERENLGFISLCILCLAARGEIQTAKQKKKKIRQRQGIGGGGAERDRNLMGEGGKTRGKRDSGRGDGPTVLSKYYQQAQVSFSSREI